MRARVCVRARVQLPGYPPALFGGGATDGEGYSIVAYFKMKPDTERKLDSAEETADNGIRLLKKVRCFFLCVCVMVVVVLHASAVGAVQTLTVPSCCTRWSPTRSSCWPGQATRTTSACATRAWLASRTWRNW